MMMKAIIIGVLVISLILCHCILVTAKRADEKLKKFYDTQD